MKKPVKFFKWTLMAIVSLLIVLFVAVKIGSYYVVKKYFAKEIVVGENTLRVSDASISIDLFQSIFHFKPTVAVRVDTLTYHVLSLQEKMSRGITVKSKTPPKPFSFQDSIALPEFKFPVLVKITAQAVLVNDSLGPLVNCSGIELFSVNNRAVHLKIASLEARPFLKENKVVENLDSSKGLLSLPLRLKLEADWSDEKKLFANLSLGVLGEKDSAQIQLDLSKTNLLQGRMHSKIFVARSNRYIRSKDSLTQPEIENLSADLSVSLVDNFSVTLEINAKGVGLSPEKKNAAYRVSDQNVGIKFQYQDTAGAWSIKSFGSADEELLLQGKVVVKSAKMDSLIKPDFLLKHLEVTANGHVRGISVNVDRKWLYANLDLNRLVYSQNNIGVNVQTGDGSKLSSNLVKHKEWGGTFSADIKPKERFVKVFTDTSVQFKHLTLAGEVNKGDVKATTNIIGVKAYGLFADSLYLRHSFAKNVYQLIDAKWVTAKATWRVKGKVDARHKIKPLAFEMENPTYGKLEFAMPRPEIFEVHSQNLFLDKLPYSIFDTLPVNHPSLSADFIWNKKLSEGNVNVTGSGVYKNEKVKVSSQANWTRDSLVIDEFKTEIAGSKVEASAKLNLHGLQFYQVNKLTLPDYKLLHLKSEKFDLAKALSIAMPNSPLKSGTLSGDFSYLGSDGFAGNFNFENIQPRQENLPITLQTLSLQGKGDTLRLFAVTKSEVEPMYNDTLRFFLTGALSPVQSITVQLKSLGGVAAQFSGKLNAYQDIQGKFSMWNWNYEKNGSGTTATASSTGKILLPNQGGEILGLKVDANVSMPFKQGLAGLILEVDTLKAVYVVPGIDTQFISASVAMQKGIVQIPTIKVHGKGGDLSGRGEYKLKEKVFNLSLEGSGIAAQLGAGNKIQLRNLQINLHSDSTALKVEARLAGASVEHIKGQLRAAGDLSNVNIIYKMPMGERKAKGNIEVTYGLQKNLPSLSVSATLDTSNVRYRMRSIESIQGLFKKSSAKRTAKRSQAMDVNINLETAGSGNSIETDVLRISYVGNFSMVGTYPFALVRGRISSREGSLGTKKQAYQIKHCELKWLNTPLEEGTLELDSEKKLARTCESNVSDSCAVIMHLRGPLNNIQFAYDSDCQGSYGAGVEVSALIFSVKRGCYSPGISAGGVGLSYQEQALILLEAPINGYLTDAAEKLSGNWIASAQVTGLGALAPNKTKKGGDSTNSAGAASGASSSPKSSHQDAIALEILSKEFWRMRLRAKSAYKPDNVANSDPWAYLLGIEYRPPLFRLVESPVWKERIKNNVSIDASIFTDPARTQVESQDPILRKLGLNYTYNFWGNWWTQKSSQPESLP